MVISDGYPDASQVGVRSTTPHNSPTSESLTLHARHGLPVRPMTLCPIDEIAFQQTVVCLRCDVELEAELVLVVGQVDDVDLGGEGHCRERRDFLLVRA